MAERDRVDIVIVGAGIAGSAMAAAMAGQGLSIALVEARPLERAVLPVERDPQHFDLRVSALTPRSRDFLRYLGAWPTIEAYRLCPYRHMTVWDAEGTGCIEFDCAEVNTTELGYIVENRAIVDALLAVVQGARDIRPLSPATVKACRQLPSGDVRLELEGGAVLETGLVVAADGALSRIRQLLGFATREWDYGHRSVVATIETARSHEQTAWQRFLPTGPLALLPLPGTGERHFCSIVWSLKEVAAAEVMALPDEGFLHELGSACENRLGPVLASSPRAAFPLRQRHAVDYVQQGVALVADAAHTSHPLAGQGINLGLADVAILAEEVLGGLSRGLPPGDRAALQRYQRRRKGENLLMMTAMEGFKRLFEQEALPLRWLRNAGMRGVDRMMPVKQLLIRHAMGLG